MTLPKELTTITPTSKYLAMLLLLSLPFVGFLLGLKYQQQFIEYLESRANVDQYILKTQPTATQSASTASPAPNGDKANWKTYTFQYAPLSFRYPSQLLLEEENPNYPPQFRGLILKTNESSLRIHPLQGPIGYESSDIYSEPLLINGKQLVINGQPVEKDRLVSRIDKEQSYLIILPYPNKNQGIFSVFITYEFIGGKINQEDSKLFDQILSTFKFSN